MIPKRPIVLAPVFDDEQAVLDAFVRYAPYELLQGRAQVMASALEQAAITGAPITDEMVEAAGAPRPQDSLDLRPVFRGYWMLDGQPRVDGLDWLIEFPPLVAAARRLHHGVGPAANRAVVRPTEIYAHVVCPDEREPRLGSHVDIPNFRGLGRRDHPTWLLVTMRRSGLFDRWHVPVAVAVIWFYAGAGGRYTYWPAGPDADPVTTDSPAWNCAVMGENDTMFHTGHDPRPAHSRPEGLGPSSVLTVDPATPDVWLVVDGDRTQLTLERARIRFALSWSAQVLADADAAAQVDDHTDDLDLDTVVDIFLDDLAHRGRPVQRPADPLHEPAWVAALADAYRIVPSTAPPPELLAS
ncbi:MAG: hypothetical protein KDB21_18565 [Acidimicrobiales bacterium]|nr:hypothetical protein [Acidimicrobiales bacterium]